MASDDRLNELVLDWLELCEQGKQPGLEEFCAACPEHLQELRERLQALEYLQRFYVPESQVPKCDTSDQNTVTAANTLTHTTVEKPAPDLCLPGYEVLEKLGNGAMGVVYKARQLGFNRLVALKMILGGIHVRREVLARFLAEAEVVARLRHPHIVQVYDFGTHEELPFFSMEFLEGGSLSDRVRSDPQPPRWAAEMVHKLADAMHAAHTGGVVHRDLKPANVLLDSSGSPRVADFGLAKWGDQSNLTATGDVMGTPSYMAPEQAEGRTNTAGPAADIWALGAILYHLLTGRPPFKGANVAETLDQVRHREPVQVRLLQPNCPRDLETICHKCLQKDAAKRYLTAGALAEDVRRFLNGEAIQARPVSVVERSWRWCRKHRALTALYGVVAIAACLLLGMALWFSAQIGAAHVERELIKAQEKARADLAQTRANAAEFVSLTNQARARIARRKPGWTWEALKDLTRAVSLTALPGGDEDAHLVLRSDAAECLTAIDVRQTQPVGNGLAVSSIAWSPDGKTLAVGQRALNIATPWCSATLIPVATPEKQRTLSVSAGLVPGGMFLTPDRVQVIAFSGDGRWLAFGTRSGGVHTFDLNQDAPKARSEYSAHEGSVDGLAFSNDGRSLYSSGGNTVHRWEVTTGAALASFTAPQPTSELIVHPQEGWLAVASNSILRLNALNLQPLAPPIESAGQALAFRPGPWGKQWIRQLADVNLSGAERISQLQIDAHGMLLIAVVPNDQDTRVRVYDLPGSQLIADLPIAGQKKVALAADGRSFAVTDEKQVRIYGVGGLVEQSYAAEQEFPVHGLCLAPDGRTLVTDIRSGNGNSFVGAWSLGERRSELEAALPINQTHKLLRLSWAPGQDELALAADAKSSPLQHWSPQSELQRTSTPVSEARDIDHDPTGRLWVAAGEEVLVWDRDGRQLGSYKHLAGLGTALTGKPGVVALAAGRERTMAACRDGSVLALEQRSGGLHCVNSVRVSQGELTSVALAADGTLAIAGSSNGELCGIGPRAEKRFVTTAHDDAVACIRSAGNGLWASGDRQGMVKLWRWDGQALHELLTLRHLRPVRDLRFLADGVQLFVLLDGERAVRRYHLDRLRTRLAQMGLAGGLEMIQRVPLPPAIRNELATVKPELPPTALGLKAEVFRSLFLHRGLLGTDFVRQIDTSCYAAADRSTQANSCRWTGWLRAPQAGRYVLALEGARLWLDGTLLLDAEGGVVRTEIDLGTRPHEVRVDHFRWEDKPLRLSWGLAGTKREVIIGSPYLYHDYAAAAEAEMPVAPRVEELRTLNLEGACAFLGFSADGKRVAAVSGSQLGVWEIETGKRLVKFQPALPETTVRLGDFSADLRLAAIDYADGTVALWNIASGTLEHKVDKRKALAASALVFSPDGRRLAWCGNWRDRSLLVFDTATGEKLWQEAAPGGGRGGIAWAKDANHLFVQSGIFDLRSRHLTRHLQLPSGESVDVLALSADGATLACICRETGRLMVFDAATGALNSSWLTGHGEAQLQDVAISPDGTLLATAAEGGLRLWQTATGACLLDLGETEGVFGTVRFSPDGRLLLTGGNHKDKTVRLWRLHLGGTNRIPNSSLVTDVRVSVNGADQLVLQDRSSPIIGNHFQISVSDSALVIQTPNAELTGSELEKAKFSTDAHTLTIPLASLPSGGIVVDGGAGDDTLTLDLRGKDQTGNLHSLGITFRGGIADNDSLVITGDATAIAHNITGASAGEVTFTGLVAGAVQYTGLESVRDETEAGDRAFTFTEVGETIKLTTGTKLHNKIDFSLTGTVEFNNPTGSLTINAGAGDDTITITRIHEKFGAALTINGGAGDDTVNLEANITFAKHKSLDVDLQDDYTSPGIDRIQIGKDVKLAFTGSGAATFKASRNIVMQTGSSMVAVDGKITMAANQQRMSTAGNFGGITIEGTICSLGVGEIQLAGKAGDTGANNIGCYLYGGAQVRGGTGSVIVEGTGGAGAGGVSLHGSGTFVTSKEGDVRVTGRGGPSGLNNSGVVIQSGARVAAGGAGTVTIHGTGGGDGSGNNGVYVGEPGGSEITSGGGNVSVTGVASSPGNDFCMGVFIKDGAAISAGGRGTVTFIGSGAAGGGEKNFGVYLSRANSRITSNGGSVSVSGADGGSGRNTAIVLDESATITTATSKAAITLATNDLQLDSTAAITAGTADVTILAASAGTWISLGAETATQLSLAAAQLDRITAGTLHIGNSKSAPITVSGSLTSRHHLSLVTGATVVFKNSVTMARDKNLMASAGGIYLENGAADLSATGAGAILLTCQRNAILTPGSSIATENGALSLRANQQNKPSSGNFVGIDVNGATLQVMGSGQLTVQGRGGDDPSGSQHGIQLQGGALLQGGTGMTTLIGSGGNSRGQGNHGVNVVDADSRVTTKGGDVQVTGVAGGGSGNRGIAVLNRGQIRAGVGGSVSVNENGRVDDH